MSSSPGDRHGLRKFYLVALVVLAILTALGWQQFQSPPSTVLTTEETSAFDPVDEPIQPLPLEIKIDLNKSALGKKLFQDSRLSSDGQISCASCHHLQAGGADNKRYSVGVNGAMGTVNAPTVFNVPYNFRFNWDGEFNTLADHTNALIQTPNVMGGRWPDVIQKLKAVPEYRQAFAKIYDAEITQANVIDAMVAYESTLTTPNAAFDRYLRGDRQALSSQEKEGYRLFKTYGCVSCHQGVNVGGNMFQKFGVIGDYFADRGNLTQADFGRFNVTQEEADRFMFRVPSLRNVALTPPYFHDGNAETLEQAIKIMVKYQLGRPIPQEHIQLIAQFLQTLTGENPESSLSENALR
ncbi:cytochrome-c peroxidase [Capilliphycus salinus ALCB114379]|uniref:cytochrome-c peroxidase n=1 Tax=Capilliphycus salinus TaxID=2768948 RepID=UPI0039A56E80